MIKVEVFRDSQGFLVAFRIAGHAGTAPRGMDIVCAGVSALTQAAVLGLENYLHSQVECVAAEGRLDMKLLDAPSELTAAILETMVIGLKEIVQLYPQNIRMIESRR